MPFRRAEISPDEQQVLNLKMLAPLASFEPRTRFNMRINESDEAKRLVALYITHHFASDGGSAFVSDGSSTFYVGLAIALSSVRFEHPFTLVTNNLAITTELDSRPTPQQLSIEIMGGQIDYSLDATFPTEPESTKRFIKDVRLVVISVRELFYLDGPTSPDLKSLLLKRHAFQIHAPIVIAADWKKLASSVVSPANKVLDQIDWDQALKDRNREIWIVCNKPPCCDEDTYEKGKMLDNRFDPKRRPEDWEEATDLERYQWEAYRFGVHDNVTFVEVAYG